MSPLRKQLIDIQNSQSFEKLNELIDFSKLASVSKEESELLANLLLLHGAEQLAKGDTTVLETFETAAKIVSYSSSIYYEQGQIFARYKDNLRCLYLAHQAFVRAKEKDVNFINAHYKDAKILLEIALIEKDIQYIVEANQGFAKVFQLLEISSSTIDLTEFYWKWGVCLAELGRLEGEPLDFLEALKKFSLAQEYGLATPEFFNDYGDALTDVGSLLDNKDYFLEALKYFTEASNLDPENFRAWFSQACCLQHLSDLNINQEYLESADSCFGIAAQIKPNHSLVWLKWAQLESAIGKLKMDTYCIENSWLKFEQANNLEPNQPILFNCWAESELFLGSTKDDLELILSAKSRVQKSLEIQPDLADTWYLYGLCLNELGHYFEDASYYSQAIEKFQYGLSLNSRSPLLWYGMALAHYALGEIKNDLSSIEKAVRFCSRVIDYGGGAEPQFWNDWGVGLLKLGEITDQAQYVEWAIEKFEKALNTSSNIVVKDHFDLEWVYHYGCAFDLLGDLTGDYVYFEKAVHILHQVVQLAPEDKEARYNYALALYHLADSVWEVEDYEKAIEQFQILIDNDPEDSMAYIDYGITLISLAILIRDEHERDREEELFRQAESYLVHATSLGNYQAFYHLAGLYSLNHLYPQALHFIERAQFCGVLPGIPDLLQDSWLENLRKTHAFRQFLDGLSSQSKDEK